jgi:tetratricopeptide (TPR) repeat protein
VAIVGTNCQKLLNIGATIAMLSHEDLDALIAGTYYDAAEQKTNMQGATATLEHFRSIVDSKENDFEVWNALDDEIGRTEDCGLRQILCRLRNKLINNVVTRDIKRLEPLLSQQLTEGWKEWLGTLAEAISYGRWRFALELASIRFPMPLADRNIGLRDGISCVVQDRWDEACELFVRLGNEESLSPELRAWMYCIAARVQVDRLTYAQAEQFLLTAKNLSPNVLLISQIEGELLLQKSRFDEALAKLMELLDTHDDRVNARISIGDCYERQNKLQEAEDWYRQSIANRPGDSDACIRLMMLYGRAELFREREQHLQPLLERAVAVTPECEYPAYIQMGFIYEQNGRHEEAHDWYNRAIKLDPARLTAHIWKAFCYLQEDEYDGAIAIFQESQKLAPGAFDPCWGMALVCEEQQRWDEALRWYDESLKRRPAWLTTIECRKADIFCKLQRYQEAADTLLTIFTIDPANAVVEEKLNAALEQMRRQGATSALSEIQVRVSEVISDKRGTPSQRRQA